MRNVLAIWLAVFALAGSAPAQPAAGKSQARLVLSAQSVRPGDTLWAAVHLKLKPGWHTYWRNPGDSGAPITVEWKLPPGVAAGALQWPAPEKLVEGGPALDALPGSAPAAAPSEALVTYIYAEETVVLALLTVAAGTPAGTLSISAQAGWLECESLCVPARSALNGSLTIAAASVPSADAPWIESWRARVPKPEPALAALAQWDKPASGDTRPMLIEWTPRQPGAAFDFFPYENPDYDVQTAVVPGPAAPGKARILKTLKKSSPAWPAEVAGLIVEKPASGPAAAYEVRLAPGGAPGTATAPVLAASATTPPPAASNAPPRRSLVVWLLFAFVGGLILNAMPCVLPVVALKILGFVRQSGEDPARVRKLGLIYGAGVLVSFAGLAGLVIAAQAAGRLASWGMQFGDPRFVVALTVLITLVALNLFGVFEVFLGSSVMGPAGQLAAREGSSGAFFNGMLAVALATPCTAPLLAPALGFAFTASPAVVFLMLMAVGLGLAAPYVALAHAPRWIAFLPKPGMWMEHFKQAMGFPMLATVVWLLGIAQSHYGGEVQWLGLFLVALSAAAWIWGAFVQRGRRRKGLAAFVALAVAAAAYAGTLESRLHWRSTAPRDTGPAAALHAKDGIPWQPWSPESLAAARARGRPVLVDFTADWCLTCQANKRFAIEIPAVQARLKALGATALLGDYTRTPDAITRELRAHGRAGVPLVLVYPADPAAPPVVLPEILRPGIVLEALDQAAPRH